MDLSEQFKELVLSERKEELLTLLKGLSTKEKKQVAKAMKSLKYLWEFNHETVTENGFTYERVTTAKGTDGQKELMFFASLICDNFQTFTREFKHYEFLTRERLDLLLDGGLPTWFNKLMEQFFEGGWHRAGLDYFDLVDFEELNLINLSPQLWARMVANLPMIPYRAAYGEKYDPLRMLKREVTLQKHIWYLFQYETHLIHVGRYAQVKGLEKGETVWHNTFRYHMERGNIDRQKLLKEALLASHRNFEKGLSGWFIGLFEYLKPSIEELISLNPELISVLNSPHSKVVNTGLKFLKQLIKDKAYDHETLIDELSMLLNSETKSVVSSVLTMFQTIARNKPGLKPQLCTLACQVFVLPTADLQLKAAKFIVKWGDHEDETLKAELDVWRTELLKGTITELGDFFQGSVQPENEGFDQEEPTDTSIDLVPIDAPQNLEDLVFFTSQAFDHNAPQDFDLLLAACIQFQSELRTEAIARLNPAFQRAFKLLMDEGQAGRGRTDHLAATFFVNLGNELIKQNKQLKESSLHQLILDYVDKDKALAAQFRGISQRLKKLQVWTASDISPVYLYFKNLAIYAYEKVIKGDKTSLLSTPTHSPHWIDPEVLIDRLATYQATNTPINPTDLEIALSRCLLDKEGILELVKAKLKGEVSQLVGYLYGAIDVPSKPNFPRAWQAAALANTSIFELKEAYKLPGFKQDWQQYHDQYSWEVGTYMAEVPSWDYRNQSIKYVPTERQGIDFKRTRTEPKKGLIGNLGKLLKGKVGGYSSSKPLNVANTIKFHWYADIEKDMDRQLSLLPNNPECLMYSLMQGALATKDSLSEPAKRALSETLLFIQQFPHQYSSLFNDFIGLTWVASDKTVRNLAGEAWIVAVERNQADHQNIGAAIGRTIRDGFLPLKRFTDLSMTLFKLSERHQNAMSVLCTSLILTMNDEPLRGSKALIDILQEVELDTTQGEEEIAAKLKGWTSSKTLKTGINNLLKTL